MSSSISYNNDIAQEVNFRQVCVPEKIETEESDFATSFERRKHYHRDKIIWNQL